jgi:hypothetical protein
LGCVRKGKSEIGAAMKRCWCIDWVIVLDIIGFFDNLGPNLVEKAVKLHYTLFLLEIAHQTANLLTAAS